MQRSAPLRGSSQRSISSRSWDANTETLEPLIVTRRNRFHPTRMEWRQHPSGGRGGETITHESATSYRVFCPAKCGTRTDIRITPTRQQMLWPIMVCHGCNSEYSTRTVTCIRCRTVTHTCRCPTTSIHSETEPSENWLQRIIDKAQTQQTIHTSQATQQNIQCLGCDGICNTKTRSGMGLLQQLQKAVQNSTTTADERGAQVSS